MKNTLLSLAAVCSSLATVMTITPAQAAILSATSGGQIISAPASVGDNDSPSQLMTGFDEKQNVLLSDPLQVDSGSIAAGEVVSSHLIFLNLPGAGSLNRTVRWTFDDIVLGVMSDRPGILEANSNSLLGAPGTTYPGSFNGRGFEAGTVDSYTGVGTNILSVTMNVAQPGDWIRVVTRGRAVTEQPVPEPVSLLGLLAVASVSTIYIRKQKQVG